MRRKIYMTGAQKKRRQVEGNNKEIVREREREREREKGVGLSINALV